MKKWWMWFIQSGIWLLVLIVNAISKRSSAVIFFNIFVVSMFAIMGVVQYLCEKNGEKGKKLFKKITIGVLIGMLVCLVPIPSGVYEDGGTRAYTALTYKVVHWKRIADDGTYNAACTYLIPKNFKSIDELWHYEVDKMQHSFVGKVIEIYDGSVVVEVLEGESERSSSDKISVGTKYLEDIDVRIGSTVRVTYVGGIMETYPAQVNERSWELLD